MNIDCRKLKLSAFSVDLDGQKLDRNLRTLLTIEADIHTVEYPDKQEDDLVDEVYKCKLVGAVYVKQGESKPIVTKSKRSQSKKMRGCLWKVNPSEDFYDQITNIIIAHPEEACDLLLKHFNY